MRRRRAARTSPACPAPLITCSELDPLRDEAIDYAVRLMRAGVAVELHVFPGTCHGFDAFVPEWEIEPAVVRAPRERVAPGISHLRAVRCGEYPPRSISS